MNFPILQNISAKSPKIPKLQHSPSVSPASLLRDDCKEFEIRVRIIDQAVGMPLWTVVAYPFTDRCLLPVKDYRAAPCRDKNNFAAVFMCMHPYRCPGTRSPSMMRLVPSKNIFARNSFSPPLKEGRTESSILLKSIFIIAVLPSLISRLEFAEEPDIILEIVAEVLDLPFEHCDTLHSHSECKSAVFLAVYA